AYAYAALITLAALALREALPFDPVMRPMGALFVLPIILSALLGGLGPGLLATAVAAAGLDLIALAPRGSLAIASQPDQFELLLLVADGVAVSALSQLLRRSLERLRRKRQLIDAVISGTSDAVFIKGLDGRYQLVNAAAAAVLGRTQAQMLGRDDRELFSAATAEQVQRNDQAVLQGQHNCNDELNLTTPDGVTRRFLVTKGPVLDAQGRAQGLFGIARDITEMHAAQTALLEREQQLARVLEGANLGYWDWHIRDATIDVNARFHAMLGYADGEMPLSYANWTRYVHPDDLPRGQASIASHLAGRADEHQVEMRWRCRDGSWRWVATRGRIVARDEAGRPLRMAGTHSDVTERKHHELALREAATVFVSSDEAIMVVSPALRITKVNPAFSRITGYSLDEIVGHTPKRLSSHRHDATFYRQMWADLAARDSWRGEIWNRRKNGEVFPELLSINAVRDDRGELQHYVAVFSDISQLKAHEAELDRIAHFDPLTGLPNRRLLADRLDQAVLRARRQGHALAVCFLDLDSFKAVNDLHGHAVGDRLLVGITEHLSASLRPHDTLARLGGDEFVLLLADLGDASTCTQVLDRVLAELAEPVVIDGLRLALSASIGVTLFPQDAADPDALLRHADQAMYLAKEAGKNRYQLFDPESDRQAQSRRAVLAELEVALAQHQFELHYQPKVDLLDGHAVGVEALVRWNHPRRGLLAPAEFLPQMQGHPLELSFGAWVIDAALGQAGAWQAAGHALTVAINISPRHLLATDFDTRLAEALARHPDVPPGRVELEVLETAALTDIDQAIRMMRRCRALGVLFALDDFGTGYSSLTYLRQLPIDTLKIDQSFVRGMLDDAEDLGIVEGVIRLAHAFHRGITAEGIETLAHARRLRAMGCGHGQGHGIARPMPPARLAEWLQARPNEVERRAAGQADWLDEPAAAPIAA
ncbi:MAG: EAL domain-containing protein, partial [Leptothrix sp. (in: b-proteobacteria)]